MQRRLRLGLPQEDIEKMEMRKKNTITFLCWLSLVAPLPGVGREGFGTGHFRCDLTHLPPSLDTHAFKIVYTQKHPGKRRVLALVFPDHRAL